MSVRSSFVEHFGEVEAASFEAAANEHGNGINDVNKGDDPFKWVILIVIGYQCAEKDNYRDHHGIAAPWPKVQAWIKAHAHLDTHNGDSDYLCLLAGGYKDYVGVQ